MPAYFGAVPCVASNIAIESDMFAPGAMPMPPTCGGERVRDVVAVQIERRDDVVLLGAQQDLLQERVGDGVLDHDLAARLRGS